MHSLFKNFKNEHCEAHLLVRSTSRVIIPKNSGWVFHVRWDIVSDNIKTEPGVSTALQVHEFVIKHKNRNLNDKANWYRERKHAKV